MAVRKQKNVDIEVGHEAVMPPAEPGHEGQPVSTQASEIPDLTVRIYPVRNSKSKLRATANVNIAGAFAVQGFRIFDSRNGLFVKEPEQSYVKAGTQLNRSVFFPITREARDKLYGQILHSYELVMDQELDREMNREVGQESGIPFLTDDDAPPMPEDISPEDDLPFEMSM